MPGYDESEVIAFVQSIQPLLPNDLGRLAVNTARMQADATGFDGMPAMGYPASRAKHYAELAAETGHTPNPHPPGPDPGPLPAPPTRDQVCRVRVGFQGETVTTREFGTFPVFGPETTSLSDSDLRAYCRQLAGRGWTHGEIAVSWQYAEPGFLMPVPGRDLTQNLPELSRRIVIMLESFKAVVVFLAGDGLSQPRDGNNLWLGGHAYNDPVGHTYGYEWLMENFPRIGMYLKRDNPYGDLTKYCIFSPGYDGVFYGWGQPGEVPDQQPDRVVEFGKLFRQVLPDGYLAIEHTPGHYPVGEGGSDWVLHGRMSTYDTILSEFNNWPAVSGDYWQIVARSVPVYHMPPDQAQHIANGPSDPQYGAANDPAAHDPAHYFYLKEGNPRGPTFYVPYEYDTYPWTRGQISAAEVQRARQYFYDMGCLDVC